jgi:glycosyltransferase involved in cell wall biosynthesis
MENKQHLDIVLPCFNPIEGWEETIIQAVKRIEEALPSTQVHLFIVNDGSSKGILPTQVEALKKAIPALQFLSYELNQGKGAALRTGVKECKSPLCIYTDIDFPYQHESFIAVYKALIKDKQDIAVGFRAEDYYNDMPKVRILISKTLRFFIKKLLRLKISDTQCGIKGFNERGKTLFLQTTINRYLFDLEFIFLASQRKDIAMSPVGVQLRPEVVFSRMNFKMLLQEGISFLKIFFKSIFSSRKG